MKKLLSELLLLAVSLTGFILLVELVYRNYFTPPDSIIRNFEEKKQPVNTVLFGNSHIYALGTPTFEAGTPAFNMAFSGINLFDVSMIAQHVVAKDTSVKRLIVGVDYDILGLKAATSLLSLQLYRYTDTLQQHSIAEMFKASSNYFRSGQDFTYPFTHKDHSDLYEGHTDQPAQMNFIPITFKSKNDMNACYTRAMEHGSMNYHPEVIPDNLAILDQLISFAAQKKLEIIFVCTPKASCYLKNYCNLEKMKDAKNILHEFFAKRKIPFYDMLQDPSFTDDDFIDFDHLNKEGSDKFIQLLKQSMAQTN